VLLDIQRGRCFYRRAPLTLAATRDAERELSGSPLLLSTTASRPRQSGIGWHAQRVGDPAFGPLRSADLPVGGPVLATTLGDIRYATSHIDPQTGNERPDGHHVHVIGGRQIDSADPLQFRCFLAVVFPSG
jgi:hypothetical protein